MTAKEQIHIGAKEKEKTGMTHAFPLRLLSDSNDFFLAEISRVSQMFGSKIEEGLLGK